MGIACAAERSDPIVDRMAQVNLFAFGGVGFAGVISEGERDYRLILSRPSAADDFEKLFARGSLEAKCYALVAMHTLNFEKFKTLSSTLRPSRSTVTTMRGCIMSRQTPAALIERIVAGEYSRLARIRNTNVSARIGHCAWFGFYTERFFDQSGTTATVRAFEPSFLMKKVSSKLNGHGALAE